MSEFKIGDRVYWNGSNNCAYFPVGTQGVITELHQTHMVVEVDGVAGNHFYWRWSKVKEDKIEVEKTGGSTPNQYRLSVNLPLTSDRTQFADVDLEALDVIDALDLSGNLKDVQKALFRMGKKDNTPVAYDLNKCLFYILREMKKREIISHGKFWEVSEMLDKMLNEGEE